MGAGIDAELCSTIVNFLFLVGMSVAAGRFFDSNDTYFVSGAPRTDLHGAVYIFSRKRNEQVMNIYKIIKGEQFGSSFGYEILVTDINKDGYAKQSVFLYRWL